jgi:hypothetical protein
MIDVLAVKAVGDATLWLRFTDGTEGRTDLSHLLASGGPMVEPLRDPAFFARVFVEMGAPTWSNGFDMDAIALHATMKAAGALTEAPRVA